MWPLSKAIRKIPRVGYSINWRLLVADYSFAGLNGEVLKEWAYLDTFDMLSPRYDSPQTATTIRTSAIADHFNLMSAEHVLRQVDELLTDLKAA